LELEGIEGVEDESKEIRLLWSKESKVEGATATFAAAKQDSSTFDSFESLTMPFLRPVFDSFA
jgi:hypothetical protein